MSILTIRSWGQCSSAPRAGPILPANAVKDRDSPLPRILLRVYSNVAARTVIRFLAGRKVRRQSDGRKVGIATVPLGIFPPRFTNSKSETIRDLISFRFMHLDEYIFFCLRCNLSPGIDLCPVEDARIVVELCSPR